MRTFLSKKQELASAAKPNSAALQHEKAASPRKPVRYLALALMSGLGASVSVHAWAEGGSHAWVTTEDRQFALTSVPLTPHAADDAQATIVIDAKARHQRIVGFGAAFTDSSVWLMRHRMSDSQRAALLQELFGREGNGVGFDFARLVIGASDFSREHYSYDDMPRGKTDPQLQHFAIDPAKDDVAPIVREALAINPNLRLMATPWSAPAWMKDNDSLIKGKLLPEHYPAFARYLLAYVDARAAQGIPIAALTVQNEPDFEPKNYPGMRFNAPERARFIGEHLGPLVEERMPSLQLFDWDHNWDKAHEPMAVLADPKASRYIDAVAWHCYGGDVSAQSQVHNAHPDKDTYMTECSSGDWEPVRTGGLPHEARLVIQSTRNWARGVLLWNLALDQDNGPHAGGCDTCLGIVTVDSRNGEVTRTHDYYALAHASRFVRRDAWRIDSTPTSNGIDNVAFENADDGTRVLMVSNPNRAARTINVRDGEQVFSYALPARSVATFVWGGSAK